MSRPIRMSLRHCSVASLHERVSWLVLLLLLVVVVGVVAVPHRTLLSQGISFGFVAPED